MGRAKNVNHKKSMRFFRFATLFIPVILVIYACLVQWGMIDNSQLVNNESVLWFSFWWLFMSALQFLVPSRSVAESRLRIIVYHLLLGSYLVFIAGLNSPLIITWIILMVFSSSELRHYGSWFSVLSLFGFMLIDVFICRGLDNNIILSNIMTYIVVVSSGFAFIKILKTQDNNRRELLSSHEREALQRNLSSTIINNLADAVISTNRRGVIQVYNAASLSLLDTNTDLNGNFIDTFFPLVDNSGKKISLFKELRSSKTVTKRDDLTYVFDGDDKMSLEITYSPIHRTFSERQANINDGYILILRDITKSKSLDEEKDEFVGVVSHELRTPITIAEGTISNVQLMLEHQDTTKSMLKDSINLAHDQIVFLAGMVNDLSTLSRAERGVADEAEYIDVRELAHKLHEKYQADAKAKKLHLDLDLSTKLGAVFVSRLYIEEMLQNLITNAIKYTNEGSVKIVFKQKDDKITFAIKDTGIGISTSDQQKIFQKFFRSEDYRTRETNGSGLGLYISYKLAHKLNTKIEVKSRLNFGSTFSFTIPITNNPKPNVVDEKSDK